MVTILPEERHWSEGIGTSLGSLLGNSIGQSIRNKRLESILKDVDAYKADEQKNPRDPRFQDESYNIRKIFGPSYSREADTYINDRNRERELNLKKSNQSGVGQTSDLSGFDNYLNSSLRKSNGLQPNGLKDSSNIVQPNAFESNSNEPNPMEEPSKKGYVESIKEQDPSLSLSNEDIRRGQLTPYKEYFKSLEATRKANAKQNSPLLEDTYNSLKTQKENGLRFDKLKKLSETGEFPGKAVAALASIGTSDGAPRPYVLSYYPQAEEFQKIVNDMLTGAKEIFGARVTNFDVQAFLRRLPSLQNSKEGRAEILHDLKILNEADKIYNEGIKDVFKRVGGEDRISFSEARRIVEEENADKFKELSESYLRGTKDEEEQQDRQEFSSLPRASEYPGKIIYDTEKEVRYKSDGKTWKVIDKSNTKPKAEPNGGLSITNSPLTNGIVGSLTGQLLGKS